MQHRDEWFFRFKTATRALIKMIGTIEDAALVAGVSKSVMHRWSSTTDADMITIAAALKLEAECGVPCVTEAMAAHGRLTLTKSDGSVPPSCMMSAFGGVADEFGDLANRVAEALRDGNLSPNDHVAINDALTELIEAANKAKGTSARLRAVGDQA